MAVDNSLSTTQTFQYSTTTPTINLPYFSYTDDAECILQSCGFSYCPNAAELTFSPNLQFADSTTIRVHVNQPSGFSHHFCFDCKIQTVHIGVIKVPTTPLTLSITQNPLDCSNALTIKGTSDHEFLFPFSSQILPARQVRASSYETFFDHPLKTDCPLNKCELV